MFQIILERLVKLELERDGLMKEVVILKEKVDDQSKTIDNIKKNEVERLNSVSDIPLKPMVAVKARLSGDVTLKVHQRLVYDLIVSNEGNAYDPQSGIFRAPVNATYIVSITACATNKEWFALNIIKDGKEIIGQLRVGDDEYKACNAEMTSTYLTTGSIIWVERYAGYELQKTTYWNSFTVALVH